MVSTVEADVSRVTVVAAGAVVVAKVVFAGADVVAMADVVTEGAAVVVTVASGGVQAVSAAARAIVRTSVNRMRLNFIIL